MATALCLYAEYTTVFALAAQMVLLARARERGLIKDMVLSWVATVLLFAPWIAVLTGMPRQSRGTTGFPCPQLLLGQ